MEQNGLFLGKNDRKSLEFYGGLAIVLENESQAEMQGVGGFGWPSLGCH